MLKYIATALSLTLCLIQGAKAGSYAPIPANFTVAPSDQIIALGERAVYPCVYSPLSTTATVTYDWSINNRLITTDKPGLRARPRYQLSDPAVFGPAALIINTKVNDYFYDNSEMICLAVVREGTLISGLFITNTVKLLIQEPLKAVQDLKLVKFTESSFQISWQPPFSLDLTNAEPDIIFIVTLVEVNGESLNQTTTQVNLPDKEYQQYTVNYAEPIQSLTLIVIPRSNVDNINVINGDSSVVTMAVRGDTTAVTLNIIKATRIMNDISTTDTVVDTSIIATVSNPDEEFTLAPIRPPIIYVDVNAGSSVSHVKYEQLRTTVPTEASDQQSSALAPLSNWGRSFTVLSLISLMFAYY